jgi:predicted O-methyltransferase YrrM
VRSELVDRIVADPPLVHGVWDETGALTGVDVLQTDITCYRLIAEFCRPGMRTLETGLGVSTALFATIGTDHTCVTFLQDEVDRLLAWCSTHQVDGHRVVFRVGDSAAVLPALQLDDLDLVLIDGGHGFPLPVLDWYHGASALRQGGLLVVDDLPLPAVGMLAQFLDLDPRWVLVDRTHKWAAYHRDVVAPLAEDWWQQPFLVGPVVLNAARPSRGDARRVAAAGWGRLQRRLRFPRGGRGRPSGGRRPAGR